MGRPKINENEQKGKIGITLDKKIILKLNEISNKSKLIEELLTKYFYGKEPF